MLRPQTQQYQLNSKKHHEYQPLCREREAEQQSNGKKFYYQLNSKKHHHYQPDLKVHEPIFAKPREVKAQELSNKGYNLPPVLQQKWVRDKESGCLTKVKDITMELKKLPADLNRHKEPEKVKPNDETSPQSNGVSSSKLKIVKNKNKNGRIVIVMSKYMDNGMQAAKVKNGDSDTAEKAQQGAENSTENHLEKMKLVKKLGLMNGFAKNYSEDKPTVPSSGFNGDFSKEKEQSPKMEPTVTEQDKHVEVRGEGQLAAAQPLQLRAKPNLFSLPLDRGVPSATDKRGDRGFQGLKRHLADTEEHGSSKRFLSCMSVSTPSSISSPTQSFSIDQNGHQSHTGLQDCGYADQEEPIDLSIVKSRPKPGSPAATQPETSTRAECHTHTRNLTEAEMHTLGKTQRDTQTETQDQTETHKSAEEDKVDSVVSVSNSEKKKEETFPSFQPFLGNIIITDITANCLTVTFKEYVTA